MSSKTNAVVAGGSGTGQALDTYSVELDHKSSGNKPRFWRWGLFIFFFANFFLSKAITSLARTTHGGVSLAPTTSNQEQEPLMSTPAPAIESEADKSKREMLEALINQQRTEEVTTDDTLERAAGNVDEFQKAFETKVSGLSGFRASFAVRGR